MGSLVTDALAKLSKAAEPYLPEVGGTLSKWAESGARTIERMGSRAMTIDSLVDEGLTLRGRLTAVPHNELAEVIKGLSVEEQEGIHKQLETGKITTPEASITKRKLDDAKDMAIQEKVLDPKDLVHNYAPKMAKEGIFEGKNKNDAIASMIKKDPSLSYAAADAKLHRLARGGQVFHNLETRRVANNLPESYFRRDGAVFLDQLTGVYKRIAEVKTWGAKDEKILDQLSKLKDEKGDKEYKYVKWLMEMKIGRRIGEQGPVPGLAYTEGERSIASLEALTKLHNIGPRHIGQAFVNVPIVTREFGALVRSIAHAAADYGDAKDFTVKSGVLLHDSIPQIRNAILGKWTLGGKELQITFSPIKRINQIIASNAGRFSAENYFKQLLKDPKDAKALFMLKSYGLNPAELLERGSLTEDNLLTAGRSVADATIFETSPSSVPPAWRETPWHRTVTLYKTYAAMEGKMVKDKIIKPALGIGQPVDLKPLIYMSIIAPSIGEITNDIINMAKYGNLSHRPDWNKYPADRIVEDAIAIGTVGLFYEMFQGMSYNDPSYWWHSVFGPWVGDVLDVSYDFGHAGAGAITGSQKHPLDKLTEDEKKRLTKSIPLAGPRLYQEYYAKRSARTQSMFEKGTITKTLQKLGKFF